MLITNMTQRIFSKAISQAKIIWAVVERKGRGNRYRLGDVCGGG